jgi:hypothetical protein
MNVGTGRRQKAPLPFSTQLVTFTAGCPCQRTGGSRLTNREWCIREIIQAERRSGRTSGDSTLRQRRRLGGE